MNDSTIDQLYSLAKMFHENPRSHAAALLGGPEMVISVMLRTAPKDPARQAIAADIAAHRQEAEELIGQLLGEESVLCYECGTLFLSKRDDDEARAEASRIFPDSKPEEFVAICHECFVKITAEFN